MLGTHIRVRCSPALLWLTVWPGSTKLYFLTSTQLSRTPCCDPCWPSPSHSVVWPPSLELLLSAMALPPLEGGGIWFCFAWENSSVYKYLDCGASLPTWPHLGLKMKPSCKGPETGLQAGKGRPLFKSSFSLMGTALPAPSRAGLRWSVVRALRQAVFSDNRANLEGGGGTDTWTTALGSLFPIDSSRVPPPALLILAVLLALSGALWPGKQVTWEQGSSCTETRMVLPEGSARYCEGRSLSQESPLRTHRQEESSSKLPRDMIHSLANY